MRWETIPGADCFILPRFARGSRNDRVELPHRVDNSRPYFLRLIAERIQHPPELAAQLKDRTEVTYLAGVKDLDFEMNWMWVLLAVICGALFLEWTIRRLSKLA